MTIKDYARYKLWKLFNVDRDNFIKAWNLVAVSFGLMIGSGLLYAVARQQHYFVMASGFLFLTLLLEIREDYKNREWYSWKIKQLKESGKK